MEQNWAGNIRYGKDSIHSPTSIDELQTKLEAMVSAGETVRVLGSRHSFNNIAMAETIIDQRGMPEQFEISADRSTVTVSGSMTYGRLVELLGPHGLAIHNLASLPHISIAGAIATGTHGSGDRNGNLATSVAGLSFLTADGSCISMTRNDADFAGMVVSLGSLGVVISVTLDCQPAFEVEQRVYEGMALAEAAERFDALFSAAYSVSIFTHWSGQADQLWVKHRVGENPMPVPGAEVETKRHPIIGIDPEACTEQFGIAGSWADRLPHFRMDFTPSSGEEIQSEFFVDRADGPEAILIMDSIGERIQDALMISEIRTIAADDLWMSQSYKRPSMALHFTWRPDQAVAEHGARVVADALGHLKPRPHWGKVFDPKQFDLSQFDRLDDFLALVRRFDPAGTFSNEWFREVFGSDI